MTLLEWTLLYVITSLFWKWIISWGGAQWVEGWKSWFFIHFLAPAWSAEGIRLFAVVMWFFTSLWFVGGLFSENIRNSGFLA
tara:strand:- start:871 stop:1116 length:246 start_codon:yes stop_codon:yes gene_type:complete